ncbi:MAG: PP2C family protein-serine/threonine phosphatase, partial [Alphaproteobacteria bacterium]
GIGGGNKGARASKLVVQAVLEFYRQWDGHQPRRMLVEAIGTANTAVRDAAISDPELKGVGSTVAALHYQKGMVRIAHVGNSRVYRQRGNVIDLMTNDHTEAQKLADTGAIGQNEVRKHPKAQVLYRAIGSEPMIEVDISDAHFVEQGDTYVICTDGLTDLVRDDEIGRAVITMKPEQACDALVTLANERGGYDNISLAVLKFAVPPRESTPFTAGLAGPPTIQRITPSRTLPTLSWGQLNLWWKIRLIALGVLVLWFIVLLLAWWLVGPEQPSAEAAWLVLPAAPLSLREIICARRWQRRRRS